MWNAFIAVWFVLVIASPAVAELSCGRIQIRPIDFGRKKPIFCVYAPSWNSLDRIAKAFSNSRKSVYRWQFLWWSTWPTFVDSILLNIFGPYYNSGSSIKNRLFAPVHFRQLKRRAAINSASVTAKDTRQKSQQLCCRRSELCKGRRLVFCEWVDCKWRQERCWPLIILILLAAQVALLCFPSIVLKE